MLEVSSRPILIRTAVLLAALAALAVVPVQHAPEPVATWTGVDALVKDQKFAEAEKKVDLLLRAAEKRRDEPSWTKALIRKVQLATGLHGYETAVRTLEERALADGTARADDPRPLLRAVPRPVRAHVFLADRDQGEDRVLRACRPEGLDARSNRRRGREGVPPRMGPPRGPRRSSGGRARRVRRPEQLPGRRPGHAARRGVVPLRADARRLVAVDAGAVERRVSAGRPDAACERGSGCRREAGRRGGAPAREVRRGSRGPRILARGGRTACRRARGAPRAITRLACRVHR